MIGTFFRQWGGAFRDAGAFARALPWIVALMIGLEMIQHVVEVRLGMFSTDPATRMAASTAPIRMAFGWPKMAMVYALGFYATRWAVTGDARDTLRAPALAIRRYWWVVLFQAVIAAIVIYAEPLLGVVGIGKPGVLPLRLTVSLLQQLAEPLLTFWYVNAAMGTRGYGPVASARATGWWYFWALLLVFAARLPFNAAHQLLNRWPAGKPAEVLWPALLLDAAVVPFLVIVVAAAQVRVAGYIAERRGRAMLA